MNPNNPTAAMVSLVESWSGCDRLAMTMNNARAVSSPKVFSRKSAQSQGTPHSAMPHIGPEVMTPMPKRSPKSDPDCTNLHERSVRRRYHLNDPQKSIAKARKDVQAKGTWRNIIRYAAGALHWLGLTSGAHVIPRNTVATTPIDPSANKAMACAGTRSMSSPSRPSSMNQCLHSSGIITAAPHTEAAIRLEHMIRPKGVSNPISKFIPW